MLEQFIKNRIISHLSFAPNKGQNELLEQLSRFVVAPITKKAFILLGYAGTGKTSIVAALVEAYKELQQKVVLLAPTGRAAKVLSHYAHSPAYTIHKYIYRQKKLGEDVFCLNNNLHRNTLFIIDEASMISGIRDNTTFGSGMLLDDLIKYVYSGEGCSLLLLGDNAQLPPVGSSISPALDCDYMVKYGLHLTRCRLTEVARQALDSEILDNASRIRPIALKEEMPPHSVWDILHAEQDCVFIPVNEVVERLEQSYNEVGLEEVIFLTRTNIRTNRYNQGIRTRILWREEDIENGDRLMVSKNNYFWTEQYDDLPFLANGDTLEISRLRNVREMYGFRFADVQLQSLDYDWEIDAVVWLDTLYSDSPEANNALHRQLFERIAEDYPELAHNKKKLVETIYQSIYYNALQVRFAYAVTGHKSQGGQWKHVYIDAYKGGGLHAEEDGFYRWLYTAITRASEKVYFIKNE
ncbi:MAG: AAA family ATPase [Paludibacteraceae bacterium]|nr:AAA family ATPase [Paludibacteraceae bacterium]